MELKSGRKAVVNKESLENIYGYKMTTPASNKRSSTTSSQSFKSPAGNLGVSGSGGADYYQGGGGGGARKKNEKHPLFSPS